MPAFRRLVPALVSLTLLGLATPVLAATWYRDLDNDNWGNSAVSVEAPTKPAGYVANPGDCNDTNSAVYPGAIEVCDGIDQDCDGLIDEAGSIGQTAWYRDFDNDTYGAAGSSPVMACNKPSGYVANSTDCNDTNANIRPSAIEACNGVDDDCDGLVDEAGATGQTAWYADLDADGFGSAGSSPVLACNAPAGRVANNNDCDDASAAIHPGATEVCDGIDQDCDGQYDNGAVDATMWYLDQDNDSYGAAGVPPIMSCNGVGSYRASNGNDCDETDPGINPGASEVCNGIDDDCDTVADDGGVCIQFEVVSISDVGNDQGRQARIKWNPQENDQLGMPLTITSYSIYRRVESGLAPSVVDATPPGTWDHVRSIPATGEALYSTVVPTLCDSTTSGICWSTFFVRAHTPVPLVYFDTDVAQGYSVDNLAPAAPQGLVITYSSAGNALAWDGDAEPDLGHWRIYRGTVPGFVPSAATLVHHTAAPSWTDSPSPTSWYYKVSAVDFSGNEGPATSAQGTTDANGSAILGFALRGAMPNPTSGTTVVSFDVPASGGKIALDVYDATGRLVGTLARGFQSAGTHRVRWDGRDSGGRMLPSGTYYLRFQTPKGTFSRPVALVR